jgi:hypothetical protein
MVGSTIEFGGYGWLVLDVRNDRMLILSDKILEKRPYNAYCADVPWERSTLRMYLNGEFYNKFNAEEKGRIAEVTLTNDCNPWWPNVSGGNATRDKIFLLSIEEVVQYFGDSGQLKRRNPKNKYYIEDDFGPARIAKLAGGGKAWWWLRSPGIKNHAAGVSDDGGLVVHGRRVDFVSGGVRPALFLNRYFEIVVSV